jgi:hypothetical protein
MYSLALIQLLRVIIGEREYNNIGVRTIKEPPRVSLLAPGIPD